MSQNLLVTYTQNNLDIFHCLPVVRRDLVPGNIMIIGESQEVIDSLINQLVSGRYIW